MKIKEAKIGKRMEVVDVNELLEKLEYMREALRESELTVEHLKFYEMCCECHKVIKAVSTQNKVLHEMLLESKKEIEVLTGIIDELAGQ